MIGKQLKLRTIPRLVLLMLLVFPMLGHADDTLKKYRPNYKALLLADADTGRVLYAEQESRKIYPASLVKMMSVLLTLEAVESGKTSLDEIVTASTKASKIGGTQVYLKEGETFSLRELLKAVIVRSANDATMAIAEHVAGNEEAFVRLMNQRAKELGMSQTTFQSPHGLPPSRGEKHDITTAYDLYLLANYILRHHPEYLQWSSIELDSFRNGTFQLVNTNRRLMRAYEGMDGMKTGFYSQAGFNLVSTAKRDSRRLISVVIGSPTVKWRSRITSYLLDKGFHEYESKTFVEAGMPLEQTVYVQEGEVKQVEIVPQTAASLLLAPNEEKRVKVHYILPESVSAPVEKGSMLGTLELRLEGRTLRRVPLIASQDVPVQSFFGAVADSIRSWTDSEE